jgi:hypothetical protein
MLSAARKLVATTVASGALLLGLAPGAGAQPIFQDGLVNVAVGVEDVAVAVPVAVGANVAANLCDIDVGPVGLAILGQAIAVDRSGRSRTICQSDAGPVTIEQNTTQQP